MGGRAETSDRARRFDRRAFLGGALLAVAGCASPARKKPPRVIKGVHLARNAGPISAAAFSSDGRFAVTAGAVIRMWDVDARKLVRSIAPSTDVRWLAVDDVRNIVAVCGLAAPDIRYVIDVLDLRSGRTIRSIDNSAFHSVDGIWLIREGLVASYSSRTEPDACVLWDLESGRRIRWYLRHVEAVSANGRTAVGVNQIWDLETERLRAELPTRSRMWSLAVSPDGTRAVSQRGGRGFLWNERGQCLNSFDDQKHWLRCAAFSPDDRFLLTAAGAPGASSRRRLVLRDAASGEMRASLEGHRGASSAIAWSPDGRRAISGDRDGDLFLWTMPEA